MQADFLTKARERANKARAALNLTKPAIHILRDSITHRELARGTYADMQALQSAFGVSYIETD